MVEVKDVAEAMVVVAATEPKRGLPLVIVAAPDEPPRLKLLNGAEEGGAAAGLLLAGAILKLTFPAEGLLPVRLKPDPPPNEEDEVADAGGGALTAAGLVALAAGLPKPPKDGLVSRAGAPNRDLVTGVAAPVDAGLGVVAGAGEPKLSLVPTKPSFPPMGLGAEGVEMDA